MYVNWKQTTSLKLSYSESDADHSGQSLNKEPKCATFTDGPPTWARVMAHGVIKLDGSITILVEDAIDYFLSKPDAEKVGVTLESTFAFAEKLFFLFASLKREPKGEITKVTSAKTMDVSEFLDFFYNVALFIKVMGNGQFSPPAKQQRLALRDQLQANFLAKVSSDPRWQCVCLPPPPLNRTNVG